MLFHVTPLVAAALAAVGLLAGVLGALVGVGGGLIVVPALVLGFGIGIKPAVATSLIAVAATSTAAGSVYVGRGLSNMRLAMTLEVFTTLGGIAGGLVALWIPSPVLAGIFGVMMGVGAALLARGKEPDEAPPRSGAPASTGGGGGAGERIGQLAGSYYDTFAGQLVEYRAVHLPFGGGVSFAAGIVSGMLGVGGGFLKVPAMTLGMNIPIKVAAATSNLMIGVTAIASLFVYFHRGFVYPVIAAPVAIGVALGALSGTRLAERVSGRVLRVVLSVLLTLVGIEMTLKAFGVSFVP